MTRAARAPEVSPDPDLSVIVVSWNTRELLRACLRSLPAGAGALSLDVRVVDNGSRDGSAEMVAQAFPEVHLLRNTENRGFSLANNQALRRARGRHLLLLNPDTEVEPGALEVAVGCAEARGGVIAARLLNPDGSLQYSCFRFPHLGVDALEAVWLHLLLPRGVRGRLLLGGHWPHDEARTVEWALGAFLLVSREALDAAGLLPENYPLFSEDMAWCRRLAEAGYPVHYCPEARVVHHGNQSAGQKPAAWRIRRTHAAKRIYLREHTGPIRGVLHRWIDVLGYALRAGIFSLLGLASSERREMGRRYRTILVEVVRSGYLALEG